MFWLPIDQYIACRHGFTQQLEISGTHLRNDIYIAAHKAQRVHIALRKRGLKLFRLPFTITWGKSCHRRLEVSQDYDCSFDDFTQNPPSPFHDELAGAIGMSPDTIVSQVMCLQQPASKFFSISETFQASHRTAVRAVKACLLYCGTGLTPIFRSRP